MRSIRLHVTRICANANVSFSGRHLNLHMDAEPQNVDRFN